MVLDRGPEGSDRSSPVLVTREADVGGAILDLRRGPGRNDWIPGRGIRRYRTYGAGRRNPVWGAGMGGWEGLKVGSAAGRDW